MSNNRVLVTGGVGFMGSHRVDALVDEGLKVVIFDDFRILLSRLLLVWSPTQW